MRGCLSRHHPKVDKVANGELGSACQMRRSIRMAFTAEQFDAAQAVPYSTLRPDLRTGDILLFHSSGVGSDVIEYFTHSLWCHAAMVWRLDDIDRVLILESVDTYGVRTMALSSRVNGIPASPQPYPGKIAVARHQAFPANPDPARVRAMTQFAIDRLGYPYGTLELLKIGARVGAGLIGQDVPGALKPENAYVCSEYVAKCYDAMGIEIVVDRQGYVAPADIANDPNVQLVCGLTHDADAGT